MFRDGYWDGVSWMIDKNGKFLRGLARAVATEIARMGVPCDYCPFELGWQVAYEDLLPQVDTLQLQGIALMEHQRRMTRELLRNGGGTVEGVTASGKTESISLLVKILIQVSEPVFFIVHRIGLMHGACERVKLRCPELAEYCGVLGDSERPKHTDKIIFSTVQTVASVHGFMKAEHKDNDMVKLWKRAGAVVVDEAHRVSGDQYLRVLRRIEEAPIFQFTGTPEVDKPIEDWTIQGIGGPIVTRVKRPELEKIGFIAEAIACAREFTHQHKRKTIPWLPKKKLKPYNVTGYRVSRDNGSLERMLVTVDPDTGLSNASDNTLLYPDYARDMLSLQPDRNNDMVAFILASTAFQRPALVLFEKIPHLYYIRGQLITQGFSETQVGVVHGEHSIKQRRAVIKKFEEGEIKVLLASTIFDEGEDVKGIGSVILAAGGADLVRMVQRVGRGVRAKDASMGNYVPVWFPIDYLTKYAREHTEARLEYLNRSEITTVECTREWTVEFSDLHTRYASNTTRVI